MRMWALAVLAASIGGMISWSRAPTVSTTTRAGRSAPIFPTSMPPAPTCSTATPPRPSTAPAQHAREQAIFGDNDAVLRLALSAVLPVRRRAAGAVALRHWRSRCGRARRSLLYLGTIWIVLRSVSRRRGAWANLVTRDRLWLLLALAFPAVFVNLGHGHNGFLTAALLGAALVVLDARPILAGILFGLLAYKPQFGVLIPLVSDRDRALARLCLGRRDRRGTGAGNADRIRPGGVARIPRLHPSHRVEVCWSKAAPAGTRSRACSPWCGCGAAASRFAYAAQGAVTVTLAAALTWLWRSAAALSAQGRGAGHRSDPRHALQPRLRFRRAGAGASPSLPPTALPAASPPT